MTTSPDVQRAKALNAALKSLHATYGDGSVMRLGERPSATVDTIPTGCRPLDVALGIGGLPRGRVIEVYGPEASGKTTLTLHLIAECQARGGTAAFIDAEHALDVEYAKQLGVDVDSLLVSQPDCGEQALEITETLVRSGAIDLLIIDSVAALVPRAEIEGEMGDHHVGLQARLMSQALRKITATVHRSGTMVVFINQIRHKIGVTFGNGEVTTGGNALKFYSSVRLEIRRIGSVLDGKDIIGAKTKIKVVKNKLAPPFKIVETEILFGKGFCRVADLLKRAEAEGVVTKSGAWFQFGDDSLGQGREKARARMNDDPKLCLAIAAAVDGTLMAEAGEAASAK